MKAGIDAVAFIAGMIMVAIGAIVLWTTFGGLLSWEWLKVATPLFLVLIGVVGLTLARPRQKG